jgi:membrane protein YdbS with pleckstrin-like domain
MIVYIDHAYERRFRAGKINTLEDIIEAHSEGTIQRVRPKLMTVSTMLIGLVPLLWAQGSGADVMKRIAAPMVGGLVTSAFLTLEIIPVIYTYWRNEQLLWRRLDEAALSILRWLERDVIALKVAGTLGLGWVAMMLYAESPPPWVRSAAVAVAIASVALLIAYPVLRHRARRLLEQTVNSRKEPLP